MSTPQTVPTPASDPGTARPVLVTGSTGPAYDALRASLLMAPGAWDASAVVPWTGEARAEHHARLDPDRYDAHAPSRPLVFDADDERREEVSVDSFVVHLHQPPTPGGWKQLTASALDLVERVGPERGRVVDVDDLVAEPEDAAQQVFGFLGLGWHPLSSGPLRELAVGLGRGTREGAGEGESDDDVRALVARARSQARPVAPSLAPTTAPGSLTAHDDGLSGLLKSLGSSLMVTTYQSDRVIVLRHDAGRLGVHLRAFDRPMGIALHPRGFALGVASEVLDYRNFAELAAGVDPRGSHDAYFVPRNSHVTGDISVHDLGFGAEGLWVVATQFSCLATLDTDHSFVPRWQPPFVSALAPEDRCHLNGLALVDGVPRYVTALGVSDEAGGWRARKADGGVVLEVPSGRTVVEGLSMPHSPRWHDGRLWVLESGRGRLLTCDPETGTTTTVAEVPGFARGLSFHGHLAFVGTSQARETATFGGLPIASLPRLECGVWAVDTRTGEIVASVRFEDRIREIFDVSVLPGVRFPDVAEERSEIARTAWAVPAPPS
ncbi:TIGR03032 family protein [Nocardioides sp.]|uniref:TIGR03032 family protein n=1 Tax=Nocardioides sp. TaxID=35761 RepID=UPI0026018034|nr:TIGR03032 family protein [Nocardioides sp.]